MGSSGQQSCITRSLFTHISNSLSASDLKNVSWHDEHRAEVFKLLTAMNVGMADTLCMPMDEHFRARGTRQLCNTYLILCCDGSLLVDIHSQESHVRVAFREFGKVGGNGLAWTAPLSMKVDNDSASLTK